MSAINREKLIPGVIGVAIGVTVSLLPPPGDLTRQSMQIMGILIWMVIWLACSVIPEYLTSLTALVAGILLKLFSVKDAFAPFAGDTTWLLVGAFAIGSCLNKTGLIKRIAFFIMHFFPGTFLGQKLALFFAGAVISPAMPSLTVKSTIICSLSRPAAKAFNFTRGDKGYAGLFMAAYWSAAVLGNFFLTGSTFVSVIYNSLSESLQATISFFSWTKYFLVFLIVFAVGGILAINLLFKPDGKANLPEGFIREQLAALGPLTRDEKTVGICFALVVLSWLLSSVTGIPSSVSAVAGLIILGVTGQFSSADFSARIPWATIVLIGCITSFSSFIMPYHVGDWLGGLFALLLGPFATNAVALIALECIMVFAIRLIIPSQFASATITYALFIGLAESAGISQVLVLFLAYFGMQCWPLAGFNTTLLSSLAVVDGDVDYRGVQRTSYAYSALVLIAALLSIPLWKLCGLM